MKFVTEKKVEKVHRVNFYDADGSVLLTKEFENEHEAEYYRKSLEDFGYIAHRLKEAYKHLSAFDGWEAGDWLGLAATAIHEFNGLNGRWNDIAEDGKC